MTHAIVLVEAERDALSTLGGALAEIDGRRRGLLGHRRVGLRRDRARARATRTCAEVVTAADRPACTASRRTQTMVAFEAFSNHDLEALFSIGE